MFGFKCKGDSLDGRLPTQGSYKDNFFTTLKKN